MTADGTKGIEHLAAKKQSAVTAAFQRPRVHLVQRDRALRVARAVRAGTMSVNSNATVHTEAPFGGYKMSGFGRELGMHALEQYTEVKNVFVDLS